MAWMGDADGASAKAEMIQSADDRLCEVPDCDRPARSDGQRFCDGHSKRIERGDKSGAPLRERLTLRERCMKLLNDIADCGDDDGEFERGWDALEHALKDWHRERARVNGGKARWAEVPAQGRRHHMRAIACIRWKRHRVTRPNLRPKGNRRPRGPG